MWLINTNTLHRHNQTLLDHQLQIFVHLRGMVGPAGLKLAQIDWLRLNVLISSILRLNPQPVHVSKKKLKVKLRRKKGKELLSVNITFLWFCFRLKKKCESNFFHIRGMWENEAFGPVPDGKTRIPDKSIAMGDIIRYSRMNFFEHSALSFHLSFCLLNEHSLYFNNVVTCNFLFQGY